MGNGARRLRGWPVRLLIAGLAVAAIFLVAAVLIALSWMNSRNLLLDAAARTANDAAQITFEHTRRMIEPASATLRTLSFDPIVSAPRLQDRLERMRLLAEELAANPLISALYVGYDNGDFLLARMLDDPGIRQHFGAPGQARFLVQTVTRAADGTAEGDFLFYDGGLSPITRRSEADYRYDPRERPWYANAGEGAALTISAPYVFFSTRQVGVSLSRRAEGGKAIVGLDIVLDDLGRMLDELRITPSAELALVDGSGAVVAYRDPRVLTARALAAGDTHLRPLDDLGVEPLSDLRRIARDGRPVSYDVAGHEWLGVMLPFDGFDNVDIRLLLTAPADELLGDLQHDRQRMVLITGGLILLFLGLGWWGGSRIGRALERTTAQAKRMSAFDFSRPPDAPAWLRETRELNGVMDNVSNTVEAFLAISDVLGAEPRIETMLAQVLEKFVHATRCRSGAIYLLQKDSQTMARAAVAGDAHGLEESLPCAGGGDAAPAAGAADGLQRVQFELRSRAGRVEGLLVLRHAQDQDHAAPGFQAFAFRLTGMLSAAIETRQLIESQKQLFDAVIRVLADAIDAKSPYTGGHCERVPALAIMMTDRMCADTSGPYADFTFTEDERYAFYLAAWLHDCGKITSAEHIVDKATKLEVIYNRIHEIRMRFEVLWRDAEIAHLRACLDGQPAAASAQARDERQAQLQDDFRFVAECNLGGEFLADEAIERLRRLGQATWLRHFDDGLGLAAAERRRLEGSRAGAAGHRTAAGRQAAAPGGVGRQQARRRARRSAQRAGLRHEAAGVPAGHGRTAQPEHQARHPDRRGPLRDQRPHRADPDHAQAAAVAAPPGAGAGHRREPSRKNGRHGLSAPPAGRGAAPDRAGDGGGRRVRGVDGRGPSLQAAQNAVRIPAHHGGHVQGAAPRHRALSVFPAQPHLAGLRAAAHEPVADRRRGHRSAGAHRPGLTRLFHPLS